MWIHFAWLCCAVRLMTWFWFWLSNLSWLLTRVVFNSDLLFCVVVNPAVDLFLRHVYGQDLRVLETVCINCGLVWWLNSSWEMSCGFVWCTKIMIGTVMTCDVDKKFSNVSTIPFSMSIRPPSELAFVTN